VPSLLVLIPLFGIILLNLPFRRLNEKYVFWFAVFLLSVQILFTISHHSLFWQQGMGYIDSFFKVDFAIDSLSFIMLLCIAIVSMVSLSVSRYTIPDPRERFKFINLLMIAAIGMNGIVITKDLFSLYVFLEITALSSVVLIAFQKDMNALEGAFKYLILSSIATIMMLFSIALILLVSPGTSFAVIAAALKESPNSAVIIFAMGIFICGLFIKGGLVPFHGWLPDAYTAAPSAVSILLAGIVTKVCGIYTAIRVIAFVFGFNEVIKSLFMFIGLFSILIGALAALGQKDLKRLLAYSSISQVGYIILGFGTGTALGMAGAVFHIFNHAVFKSLLFVNAAAVEKRIGSSDLDRMGGLSYRMPITGSTSVIGVLSTCGIPPLAGFWSKLVIIIALWQSGHYMYGTIAVLASILTLAYLLLMQRKAFFGKLPKELENLKDLKEVGPEFTLPSIILAMITISVGVFFPFVFDKFVVPIKSIFMQ